MESDVNAGYGLDLDERLHQANIPGAIESSSVRLVPFARNPVTLEDRAAKDRLTQETLVVQVEAWSRAECPIGKPRVSRRQGAGSIMGVGESFSVSLEAAIVPARVKICQRYQTVPGSVSPASDTYNYVVQSGDASGPCNVTVYIPWLYGSLAVYTEEIATVGR